MASLYMFLQKHSITRHTWWSIENDDDVSLIYS